MGTSILYGIIWQRKISILKPPFIDIYRYLYGISQPHTSDDILSGKLSQAPVGWTPSWWREWTPRDSAGSAQCWKKIGGARGGGHICEIRVFMWKQKWCLHLYSGCVCVYNIYIYTHTYTPTNCGKFDRRKWWTNGFSGAMFSDKTHVPPLFSQVEVQRMTLPMECFEWLMCGWVKNYHTAYIRIPYICGDEHPFPNYFRVHQGFPSFWPIPNESTGPVLQQKHLSSLLLRIHPLVLWHLATATCNSMPQASGIGDASNKRNGMSQEMWKQKVLCSPH